jgi:hypothetical protein
MYQQYQQNPDLQFQTFSYSETTQAYAQPQQSVNLNYPQPVTWSSIKGALTAESIGNEPPLLIELGINFEHIFKKGITVLNPMKRVDQHLMDDSDLAGPVMFCFLFGGFLLLSGKAHFEYIYGVAVLGVVSIYGILNLMSEKGVKGSCAASVLGYSLLPMVILSSISILFQLRFVIIYIDRFL